MLNFIRVSEHAARGVFALLRHASRSTSLLVAVFLALSLSACASNPNRPGTEFDEVTNDINDPLEPFNRKMFAVNDAIDKASIKPAAKGYDALPNPITDRAHNFIQNLREPVTVANDILQWEWKRASVATGRFFVNTTIGVVGLFDPAAKMGLDHHVEDFGQTLAVWGAPEGNYGYLPILGPAPTRDTVGWIVDIFFDPLVWVGGASVEAIFLTNTVIGGLDLRAENLETLDELEASSVDYYASIRNLYRQTRARDIRNGADDFSDLPDFDEFDEDF